MMKFGLLLHAGTLYGSYGGSVCVRHPRRLISDIKVTQGLFYGVSSLPTTKAAGLYPVVSLQLYSPHRSHAARPGVECNPFKPNFITATETSNRSPSLPQTLKQTPR